jgi:predicted GTPase
MAVNIRKFVQAHSLDELVALGTITAHAARFLEVAVASGLNVLVSGGTQAGKSTLHTRLKALPWTDVHEATRVHSIGHGRIETRTIRVIDPTGSSDGQGEFVPGAAQAIPGTVAQRPISAHR